MTAKSFWVFLIPVFISYQSLIAQQINIEKIDDTLLTENISSIENIMFTDNNLEISFYSAPSETINPAIGAAIDKPGYFGQHHFPY
ncbi:MAG: hypothetical protein JW731_10075 [Bacteroidales bacterium]|nr:hypothetical protein [Bacteroidales bacterium]